MSSCQTSIGSGRRAVLLSGLTRLTGPTDGPLDVDDSKKFLRVSSTDDDVQIAAYLAAAVGMVERTCRISLMEQTWRSTYDAEANPFGDPESHVIDLANGPILSVESVKYRDSDGTLQTIDSGDYTVDIDNVPGRIVFPDGLPDLSTIHLPSLVVEYTSGYADASSVPANIVHALRFLVSHFYENRLPVSEKAMSEVPMAVRSLLAPYVVHAIA